VRESIRGYADGVFEDAAASGDLRQVVDDLAGVVRLVADNENLRGVLADPGVPVSGRRAVVEDLLASRVRPDTLRLILFALASDRAPEVTDNLAALAAWARRAQRMEEAGRREAEDPVGRMAARERLEGYAAAILERVAERGSLAEVEDELFRFARVVESNDELKAVLTDRAIAADARAGVVGDLLSAKAQAPTVRLASYSARSGSPRDFVGLLDWLVELAAAEADRRVAEVRSAVELSDDERSRLAAALGWLTGRTVEVRDAVDARLLGGFVATVGDTVVEGSVRHRLEQLRERFHLPEINIAPTAQQESS